MAIQNGLGQTSYQRLQSARIAGNPSYLDGVKHRTRENSIPTNLWDGPVAGTTTDGIYSLSVQLPDGTVVTGQFDRQGGETDAQIAAAIVADFQTAANALLIDGHAVVSNPSAANLRVLADHPGVDLVVTSSAPAPGTLVMTETQSASGTEIPIARFLVLGAAGVAARQAALPDGAVAADIEGVSLRHISYANKGGVLTTDEDTIPVGELFAEAYKGAVDMLNVGADANEGDPVHIVVNVAGGDELGEARGDADGGNTIVMGARVARWDKDTPSGTVGPVYLDL